MNALKGLIIIVPAVMLFVSCSSSPQIPFNTMVEDADIRVGEPVILGGYILDSNAAGDKTEITFLQTPLDWRTKPLFRDKSEGRFLVSYNGKFNPHSYDPEDRFTVNGTIVGIAKEKIEHCPSPCLKIDSSNFRVWREHEHYYPPSGGPGP